MADKFQILPVGIVKKQDKAVTITVYKEYENGLLGLDQFSHIIVLYWFHKNDSREQRKVLQVHPRKNKNKPLTGVFATHSPVRPNLIAISTCKMLSIDGNVIHVEDIDAFDETPVIDIKPYIPETDLMSDIKVPWWVEK
jgi:tRNA-Thr(GGU) m(6)t(6)A37 methyltransferase TsaA